MSYKNFKKNYSLFKSPRPWCKDMAYYIDHDHSSEKDSDSDSLDEELVHYNVAPSSRSQTHIPTTIKSPTSSTYAPTPVSNNKPRAKLIQFEEDKINSHLALPPPGFTPTDFTRIMSPATVLLHRGIEDVLGDDSDDSDDNNSLSSTISSLHSTHSGSAAMLHAFNSIHNNEPREIHVHHHHFHHGSGYQNPEPQPQPAYKDFDAIFNSNSNSNNNSNNNSINNINSVASDGGSIGSNSNSNSTGAEALWGVNWKNVQPNKSSETIPSVPSVHNPQPRSKPQPPKSSGRWVWQPEPEPDPNPNPTPNPTPMPPPKSIPTTPSPLEPIEPPPYKNNFSKTPQFRAFLQAYKLISNLSQLSAIEFAYECINSGESDPNITEMLPPHLESHNVSPQTHTYSVAIHDSEPIPIDTSEGIISILLEVCASYRKIGSRSEAR